jgi:FMN reductase
VADSLLTAVLGSATPPGRLHRAVTDAAGRLGAAGAARVELVDLAQRRIAFVDGRPPEALADDTAALIDLLSAADGVVLATPVYRGSLTGALKNLLDHAPVPVLEAKPTALVAMGGSDHHFLGADRHLRDILAFFGADVLPTAVYLTGRDFTDGTPGERGAGELDALLALLTWRVRARRGEPAGTPPAGPRSLGAKLAG